MIPRKNDPTVAWVGVIGLEASEIAWNGSGYARLFFGVSGTSVLAEEREQKVVSVPIAALKRSESPRSTGEDREHIARLAQVDEPLPPLLVDRGSMRVIDGMHRLGAAIHRGQQRIDVTFFDGTAEDAFLRAVEANVRHGLPLSVADRRAAAVRIVASHPHMSDRAIAQIAGLGAKTVAAIRRGVAGAASQPDTRVGRDGKVRPLNGAAGRRRAAQLIAERPQASLREVARLAGISPATASDVRKRMSVGEAPVLQRPVARDPVPSADTAATQGEWPARRVAPRDPASVLEKLLRDPALRHQGAGRQLLSLLRQNAVIGTRGWADLIAAVPPHCRTLVVDLARQYAETWQAIARELNERVQPIPR
ncbi:ParB/RepB/Spo0J family partition protein [Streptomyces sp. 7R007]